MVRIIETCSIKNKSKVFAILGSIIKGPQDTFEAQLKTPIADLREDIRTSILLFLQELNRKAHAKIRAEREFFAVIYFLKKLEKGKDKNDVETVLKRFSKIGISKKMWGMLLKEIQKNSSIANIKNIATFKSEQLMEGEIPVLWFLISKLEGAKNYNSWKQSLIGKYAPLIGMIITVKISKRTIKITIESRNDYEEINDRDFLSITQQITKLD